MTDCPITEPAQCGRCQGALEGRDSIRLWDGKVYCHECIEMACPGMYEYATEHDQMEETTPYRLRRRLAEFLVFVMLVYAGLAVFIQFVAARDAHDQITPLNALAWSAVVAVAICAPWTTLGLWFTRMYLPTVIAREGNITVRRSASLFEWGRHVASETVVQLSDCTWSPGIGAGPMLTFHDMLQSRINIRYPMKFLGLRINRGCATVGFTEDTRRLWKGFLTLATVPNAGIDPGTGEA